jgi:hypothetical protein
MPDWRRNTRRRSRPPPTRVGDPGSISRLQRCLRRSAHQPFWDSQPWASRTSGHTRWAVRRGISMLLHLGDDGATCRVQTTEPRSRRERGSDVQGADYGATFRGPTTEAVNDWPRIPNVLPSLAPWPRQHVAQMASAGSCGLSKTHLSEPNVVWLRCPCAGPSPERALGKSIRFLWELGTRSRPVPSAHASGLRRSFWTLTWTSVSPPSR